MKKYYYTIKPFIPRWMQISLRRHLVRWQRERYKDVWPIHNASSAPPENWAGWPDGKKFALVLTHDVDTEKGQQRCRQLAEMEMELGFRSSFNFVPKRYSVSADLRRYLVENGFEVGVHGLYHDGKYYQSREEFNQRAKLINEYLREWNAVGFRSPSMLRNMEWILDLDIEYDSSTFDTDPFEPQADGVHTIFPFIVEDKKNGKSYVELPYTMPQDFTLFVLLRERVIDIWKRKLDWIVAHGGMVLMNVHPDYMNMDGGALGYEEYPSDYYRELLTYIRKEYDGAYWGVLPRELTRFCKQQVCHMKVTAHKKIRACMISYSFYDGDNRVRRYAEALADRGDAVDVIALRAKGQKRFDIINGVNVHRIQERVRNEKKRLDYLYRINMFFLKSLAYLSYLHCMQPYHLIHVHSVPDYLVFTTAIAKMTGAKVILDIHDILPEFYASKFTNDMQDRIFKYLLAIERISARYADHVIIANHIWEKKLIERAEIADKCSVFLNYPDSDYFSVRSRKRKDEKIIMIYPGSLNWHQGLDIALDAFSHIKNELPTAEFHIYGTGEEIKVLKEKCKILRLDGRVVFHGPVTTDKIADIIANADIGIVPKRDSAFGGEAFSTKILEFMIVGVPVIASATKIDKHYFNEDVVRFFQSGDDRDLARAMKEMITDKSLRDNMAKKGLEFAKDYSWDLHKQRYFNLVDDLTRN